MYIGYETCSYVMSSQFDQVLFIYTYENALPSRVERLHDVRVC